MNTKNDQQNRNIDLRILRLVHEIRTEFQACALRTVASRMRLSPTAVRNRMVRMRGEFLDWNEVPGSVHLLPAGFERIGVVVPAAPVDDGAAASETPMGAEAVDPQLTSEIKAAIEAAMKEMSEDLERRVLYGITGASTRGTAAPEAEAGREEETSPEGPPAGTPGTDPNPAPASPAGG